MMHPLVISLAILRGSSSLVSYKITFAYAVTGTYLYLYFSSLDLDHFPQSLLQHN